MPEWVTNSFSVDLAWGDSKLGKIDVPAWVVIVAYYFYSGGWDAVGKLVKTYLVP